MAGKDNLNSVGVRANKLLRVGDKVIVLAGGNKKKRPIKGLTAKIKAFQGDRLVLDGINLMTSFVKANGNQAGQAVKREGSVHLSNVMAFSEKEQKPVRLVAMRSDDGALTGRGYKDRASGRVIEYK